MKRIFLATLLLASFASFAEVATRDNYCAYLSTLLAQGTIGDEELKRLIDHAQAGNVVNPITPARANSSAVQKTAYRTLNLLLGSSNAAAVLRWAEGNLSEQSRVAREREKSSIASEEIWNDFSRKIVVGEEHACALSRQNQLACWTSNRVLEAPQGLGAIKGLMSVGPYTCARIEGAGFECWTYEQPDKGSLNQSPTMIDWSNSQKPFEDSGGKCRLANDRLITCEAWRSGYPVFAPEFGGIRAMADTHSYICVIRADQSLACQSNVAAAAQVEFPLGLEPVRFLASSGQSICIIRKSGAVACLDEKGRLTSSGEHKLPSAIGENSLLAARFGCYFLLDEAGDLRSIETQYEWCEGFPEKKEVLSFDVNNGRRCILDKNYRASCEGSNLRSFQNLKPPFEGNLEEMLREKEVEVVFETEPKSWFEQWFGW